ncbi:MAG: hypothetical protein ACO26I_11170, partial [Burkholderiaceae bacterium]
QLQTADETQGSQDEQHELRMPGQQFALLQALETHIDDPIGQGAVERVGRVELHARAAMRAS